MQYLDIMRKAVDTFGDASIYENGDYEGEFVLILDDYDDRIKYNEFFKKEVAKEGIEDKGFDYDTYYIDLVTDDAWDSGDLWETYFYCDCCGKVYVKNQYYHRGWVNEQLCEMWCENCVKEDPSGYIDYLINQPNHANTILEEETLNKYGFFNVDPSKTYEYGWYGRVEKPETILKEIREKNPEAEVIFNLYKTYNPWASEYSVFIREGKTPEET